MEKKDWARLRRLCVTALEEMPESRKDHPITEALNLTGAFASSVLAHWDVSEQPQDGGHDEVEYQRGIEDTKRAQEAGPAGSPEREQAYREMEAQWEREGFDG
jgi:hypothetical protein